MAKRREKKGPDQQNTPDSAEKSALQMKTHLIDNLAYQVRTLSNAIIGFSNLLSAEALTDTQREYVTEIHHAGRGLSAIVNDVLDLARMEAGNLRPDYSDCDLAELLEDIEDIITRAAAQKGLEFNIIPAADMPARMHTDPARLKRCLLNLIGNAVQHTHQGYVNVLVGLESESSEPMIRFDVVDTGVGISAERLTTVFEPVRQTEKINIGMLASINLGVQSCGVLSMTRQLVELLGGRIEVISEPGVGSTFSVLVPAGVDIRTETTLVFPPNRGPFGNQTEPQYTRQCFGNILLVEDEESNRTVLSLLLENLGMEVATAAGGQEAMKILQEKTFDAVLMDIQLPDLSGYEVTRRLRDQGLTTPIIALSAGVLDDSDDRQISELFNAFLAKPIDRPQLAETLEAFLPTVRVSPPVVTANQKSE